MQLAEIINTSVKHNATDLHLCTGEFPYWRISGEFQRIPGGEPIRAQQIIRFCHHALQPELQRCLQQRGCCEFALETADKVRLRASLFRQKQGLALALRFIQRSVPPLSSLHLPAAVTGFLTTNTGLLVVAGPTGAGKSTTLAALIAEINQQQAKHIITLEDPIEYAHLPRQCLIQQREIGRDLMTLEQGISDALRQDPDIIMIGELREVSDVRLALLAAESGHLVMTTLHSANATHSIERLIGMCPETEHSQIRSQLAQVLVAVLNQKMEFCQNKAIAIFEVLVNNHAVASVIRSHKTYQLQSIIETGREAGMIDFVHARQQLVHAGLLTENG